MTGSRRWPITLLFGLYLLVFPFQFSLCQANQGKLLKLLSFSLDDVNYSFLSFSPVKTFLWGKQYYILACNVFQIRLISVVPEFKGWMKMMNSFHIGCIKDTPEKQFSVANGFG